MCKGYANHESWPNVGLCNGATGNVLDIIYCVNHQPPDLPIAVIVKFDDYRGPSITDTLPSCVPICPVTANLADGVHERQQLPLTLAYALTNTQEQGTYLLTNLKNRRVYLMLLSAELQHYLFVNDVMKDLRG